jgi:RNA polymerase sigma factor for flagellar operon FliA
MVTYLADRMKDRLPNHVDTDDVRSTAALGLVDAIRRFDPKRGVSFSTYAPHRMRGHVLDELRELDWVPRLVRSRKEPAIGMQSMSGFAPDLRYPHEFPEAVDRREDPVRIAGDRDLWRRLREILTAKQVEVLDHYYRGNYTLKQIGQLMGLSESRVCQLHARAIHTLRRRLAGGPG